MFNRYIAVLAVLFLILKIEAQPVNLHWAKPTGGLSSDAGFSIATDKAGNVYTAGNFRDKVDFDPGPGVFMLRSKGDDDIFISKFDGTGNFVWAKQIGGTDYDNGSSITIDDAGNIYMAGFFQGTCDVDPGPNVVSLSSNGSNDVFVCKLNPAGNLVWARQFGGPSSDMCLSVSLDSTKNIYIGGYFIGAVDFDPGPGSFNLSSHGAQDIFVSKFDNDGNFLWTAAMGGPLSDMCNAIAADKTGNCFITGSFMSTADFDPGSAAYNLTSSGLLDAFAAKLDNNGRLLWAGQMGSPSQDEQGYAIAADAAGNAYLAGNFNDSADFDPGPGVFDLVSNGSSDIFVVKLDNYGNLAWAKQMGGSSEDAAYTLAVDTLMNVYTAGSFGTTADFDPGNGNFNITATGMYDIFISKLNASGNFVWAEKIGGDSLENALAMTVDKSGNIYATGYFTSKCDFDPGIGTYTLSSAGRYDIFTVKLGPGVTGVNENEPVISGQSVFPNPTTGIVNVVMRNKTEQLKLTVMDVTGQTVLEKSNLSGSQFTLDLSALAEGIYFLEMRQGQQSSQVKIVKTH